MRVKPLQPGPLWRFFASVWLAIGLMALIGVVSALGHGLGIKETEEMFFGSWWFSALMIVLGLNILVCTLSRSLTKPPGWFPWRLSQIPWLMTHLGLLVIIVGGVLTAGRIEGQLFVMEGTADKQMFLQDREVVIERPNAEPRAYDIKLTHLPQTKDGETLLQRRDHIAWIGGAVWVAVVILGTLAALWIGGREPALFVGVVSAGLGVIFHVATQRAAGYDWELGDGARMQFERYYPHYEHEEVIEADPSGQGPPGIEVHFKLGGPMAGQETTRWLVSEPGYSNMDQLGPVGIAVQRFYTPEGLEKTLRGEQSLGAIVVRAGAHEAAVSLDAAVAAAGPGAQPDQGVPLDRWVEVGGHKVHLARFYWKMVVVNDGGRQLPRDDAPGQLQNPAVQIDRIEHADGRVETFDRFYAFGNPQFRGMTVHAAPTTVDVSYRFPVWQLPQGKGLSFVVGPTSKDVALLRTGPDRPAPPTTAEEVLKLPRVDGPITPEGSPVTLKLLRHEWSIHQRSQISPVDPKTKTDGDKLPDAVFARLKVGDQEDAKWLPFGLDGRNRIAFNVGGETWHASYRSKSLTLPFDMFLKDFKIEWAPGQENQRPLAFESEVTVKDPRPEASIPSFDYRVYMNHTLVHGGFTFFQSSYIRQPGQPDISIFQVTSDPGEYLFYVGSIVMTLGVLSIFYMKPWLRNIELRQRGQAPAGKAGAMVGTAAAEEEADEALAAPPALDAPPPTLDAPPAEVAPATAPAVEAAAQPPPTASEAGDPPPPVDGRPAPDEGAEAPPTSGPGPTPVS